MTPQERQLIAICSTGFRSWEGSPRDATPSPRSSAACARAERGLCVGADVLVQDEALKRANAASGNGRRPWRWQQQSGSFLDSMRDAVFGQGSRRAAGAQRSRARCRQPAGLEYGQPCARLWPGARPRRTGIWPALWRTAAAACRAWRGGSFLGTAAAAAAGVVGGSLLLSSIRGMMGGGHQQSFGDAGGLGFGRRRQAVERSIRQHARA